jgi:L-ascorbate metabolism protein UlaG (beta-lactamase superfamily)
MADGVTYVGHSTVLVDLDGSRLLTDPILRSRILHLRRHAPIPLESVRDVGGALVSHTHWDHFDVWSLKQLGRATPIVVPTGAGSLLRRHFAHVLEVESGDEVKLGPLTITATHAEHGASRRRPGRKAPALGFVIAGSKRVYFAGDTDLFAGMAELAPLDVALLPVAGWGKRLGPGHLDAQRAAEALGLLRPRVAIPIHWGTLAPFHHPRPTSHAAEAFQRAAAELAPEVDVRVLAPGETTPLD